MTIETMKEEVRLTEELRKARAAGPCPTPRTLQYEYGGGWAGCCDYECEPCSARQSIPSLRAALGRLILARLGRTK